MNAYFLLIVVFLLTGVYSDDQATSHVPSDLFHALMGHGYNSKTRPRDHNETTNVTVGLSVVKLIDFNEQRGYIELTGWLALRYTDPRLVWDPSEYGGMKTLPIPDQDIWRPDLHVYNGYENTNLEVVQVNAHVSSDGEVRYVPPVRIRSICAVEVTNVPNDKQICFLKIGSWVHNGLEINLVHEDVTLGFYHQHLEWELTDIKSSVNQNLYPCCPEPYPEYHVEFNFKRKGGYIHWALIVPACCIGITTAFSFLIPLRSNERLSVLGILLLAQLAMFLIVQGVIPMNRGGVPNMIYYNVYNVITISVSLGVSFLLMNLVGKSVEYPPPRIISGVLGLGWLCCKSVKRRVRHRQVLIENDELSRGEMTGDKENPLGQIELMDILARIDQFVVKKVNENQYEKEWLAFATMIDRFLFILFLVLNIIMIWADLY